VARDGLWFPRSLGAGTKSGTPVAALVLAVAIGSLVVLPNYSRAWSGFSRLSSC